MMSRHNQRAMAPSQARVPAAMPVSWLLVGVLVSGAPSMISSAADALCAFPTTAILLLAVIGVVESTCYARVVRINLHEREYPGCRHVRNSKGAQHEDGPPVPEERRAVESTGRHVCSSAERSAGELLDGLPPRAAFQRREYGRHFIIARGSSVEEPTSI